MSALLVARGHGTADVGRIVLETARDGGEDPRMGAGIVGGAAAVSQRTE